MKQGTARKLTDGKVEPVDCAAGVATIPPIFTTIPIVIMGTLRRVH